MTLDIPSIRRQFPALSSDLIYFDNPGGTQVPSNVIDRMVDYLVTKNANHDGAFRTSQASDALVDEARLAAAAMVNAEPDEIVFGANMTTLTLHLSRSLARTFEAGDEIVVTRLDHDANIAPWLMVAQDRGCSIRWLDFDVEDCTLRLDQLDELLTPRTRLVAVGYASNAVGTINPVETIIRRAHQVGALCYIDAVQYAPHGAIDVKALQADFLVMSAYKFFGPHVGVLYGKRQHLESLQAYKVRPAPSEPPGKFETGTGNFEGLAGLLGAIEYLESLTPPTGDLAGHSPLTRHHRLRQALSRIREHEAGLSCALLEALASIPGLRLYGLTDPEQAGRRVPTVAFTLAGWSPRAAAARLGELGIQVWDGNYYALAVTERLGLEADGGMIRVGLVHYNTLEEIERLRQALLQLAAA